jgi:hypothetical protein
MPAAQAGDPDGYHANISDTQGVQVGSGIQINLFGGRDKPPGPVVAGKVPQVPPASQSRADLLAQLRAAGPGVCNRLEADGEECLIVFDNVTDPEAVRPYVPSLGSPQVLITSTEHAAVALGKLVQVAVFTEEEDVAFLADRTRRADVDGARALAGELGYLPLALSLASAVMVARHLAYDVYLRRLRACPAQRRLLNIVAVLSPDGVPRDLLYKGEPAETSAEQADAVDEALSRLAEASLLTYSGQARPRLERVPGPEHQTIVKVRANLIDARQRARGLTG